MKSSVTLCLIKILLITVTYGQVEIRNFQTKALGQEIGSVRTETKTIGEEVTYSTFSMLDINLLVKRIKLEVINEVSYRSGQLMKVHHIAKLNGEKHTSSEVEWKGSYYAVKVDGEVKPPIQKPIYYSGSVIYSNEPSKYSEIFSESSGVFMKVENEGNGIYQTIDPRNNRKLEHHYKNCRLLQTKIKHPILTVYILPITGDGSK